MGRIESLRRFQKSDYPEAPDWFDKFINSLNRALEDLITQMQGGLTVTNENAESIVLEMTHNVAQDITASGIRGDPTDVRVQKSDTAVDTILWTNAGPKTANVTLKFDGAPTAEQTVKLKIKSDND